MSFAQLHIHSTGGSFLDAIGSSNDYVKKAKENNHPFLATTDHGRLNNIWNHQQACKKGGIKPLLGVEMYINQTLITEVEEKRKRTKDQHLILLAGSKEGYQNLLYLNYLSNSDDAHFYYSPRITPQELLEHSSGLFCGSACLGSPFAILLKNNKAEEAEKLFTTFLDTFKERFYAEIQLNEITGQMDSLKEGQKTYNNWLIEIATKYGVPLVLTGDVHYAEKGQDKLQTLSIAIRDKATIDKLNFELESKNLYYHSYDDYIRFNKEFGYNYTEQQLNEWYNNTGLIAEKINFTIPERTKMYLPTLSDDDEMLLITKAKAGLVKYFNVETFEECPFEYKKRLLTELQVIIEKGFSNYLLILEDLFRYANENDITTSTGRGSACGSLVVFCLNITKIDPIKYGLFFERFISAQRMKQYSYDFFVDDEE